jgi:TonB family protein
MRKAAKACMAGLILVLSSPFMVPAHADVPSEVGTNVCGADHPVRPMPIMATHQLPPYPPEAVRLGEQGVSVLKVVITPTGTVMEDSIVQSSGSDRLDSAALDFVKQTWRWQPMPDCKTPMSLAVSINWRLRSAPSPIDPAIIAKLVHFVLASPSDYPAGSQKQKTVVLMMGVVSVDGHWDRILPLRGSGDAALDAKSVELVQARQWLPMKADGKPIAGISVIGVIWTPPGETPPDPDQIGKVFEFFAPPRPSPPP